MLATTDPMLKTSEEKRSKFATIPIAPEPCPLEIVICNIDTVTLDRKTEIVIMSKALFLLVSA